MAKKQFDTISKSETEVPRIDRETTFKMLFFMERWNCSFTEDSFQAAIYSVWENLYYSTLFVDQITDMEVRDRLFSCYQI